MSGAIYLVHPDGQLIAMTEQGYVSEDRLQRFLEEYPDLLAGDQMDGAEPRRWLLISREMSVPSSEDGGARWYLDHLFLDQDAVPTLVEVKRSTDSRIRREVIGQMLDYAANSVVHWPAERIRTQFESSCTGRGEDPTDVLQGFLGPEADLEDFWSQTATNLQAGKIRLVFVADVIPPELRRVVEFLNSQMTPAEVVAVEVKQYIGESLTSLVPRVVGQTARAQQSKASGRREKRAWDEDSFFNELTLKRGETEAQTARRIFEWIRAQPLRYTWGNGATAGSLLPFIEHAGEMLWPFSVWTYGSLEVQFQWLKNRRPFQDEEQRLELLERLNAIEGIRIPASSITKRPPIRLATLSAPGVLPRFLDVMGWVVNEVRAV